MSAPASKVKRPDCQIQIAHDVLHSVLINEVEVELDDQARLGLHSAHDALSWILGYPCGETFAHNLKHLTEEVAAAGYVLRPISEKEESNGSTIH